MEFLVNKSINPLKTKTPKMGTLENSEDPDEMPQYAAFHQGLHCLLRQNQSSEKNKQYLLEIMTCDPSVYTMDHPDFIICSFMENSIGLKRVYPFTP